MTGVGNLSVSVAETPVILTFWYKKRKRSSVAKHLMLICCLIFCNFSFDCVSNSNLTGIFHFLNSPPHLPLSTATETRQYMLVIVDTTVAIALQSLPSEASVYVFPKKRSIKLQTNNGLKEQYPVTAHVPHFDFLQTGCREFKRCEESKRTVKNPFASRLAEFNTSPNQQNSET